MRKTAKNAQKNKFPITKLTIKLLRIMQNKCRQKNEIITKIDKKMKIIEIWKEIPGFEGKYKASNTGKVKTLARFIIWGNKKEWREEKLLKPCKGTNNYYYVNLYKNGRNRLAVHYIVLLTFKEDRPEGLVINHKDGNKINNNLSNLEYCTQAENMQHASKNNLLRVNPRKKTKNKRVGFGKKEIKSNWNEIKKDTILFNHIN